MPKTPANNKNPQTASSIVNIPINPSTPIKANTNNIPVGALLPVNKPATNNTKINATGVPVQSPNTSSSCAMPPPNLLGPKEVKENNFVPSSLQLT